MKNKYFISEEEIKRMMIFISLVAIIDQEGIGDRFYFIYEDGKSFMPDFCEWLKQRNPTLYNRAIEERYGDSDIEHLFWLDQEEDDDIGGYDLFRECVIYIYNHPDAFNGVIKYIEEDYGGIVDSDFFNYGWDDVAMYSHRFICSREDAKREFEILKSYRKNYETIGKTP